MNQDLNNEYVEPVQNNFSDANQGNNAENKPKKKHTVLLVLLCVFGVIGAIIFGFIILFSIESAQTKPWQSGEIEIFEKKIKLPCDVNEFEKTFDTKIILDEYDDEAGSVILIKGTNILEFNVFIENGEITSIILEIFDEEIDDYDYDLSKKTLRESSKYIKFPGGVTAATPISEIKKIYDTKPLNTNYRYWSERIGDKNILSAGHRYSNNKYSIEFKTLGESNKERITEIMYSYNN